MIENIATTRVVTKKEMVLSVEARGALAKAFHILENISEEWDEDYPCFRQAHEALADLLEEKKFEMILSKESG